MMMHAAMSGSIHWLWLQYTTRDDIAVDVFRWMSVAVAGFVVARAISITLHKKHVPMNAISASWVFAMVAVIFALNEVQQIGQRFLVWRLPSIFVVLCGMVFTMNHFENKRRQERDRNE